MTLERLLLLATFFAQPFIGGALCLYLWTLLFRRYLGER